MSAQYEHSNWLKNSLAEGSFAPHYYMCAALDKSWLSDPEVLAVDQVTPAYYKKWISRQAADMNSALEGRQMADGLKELKSVGMRVRANSDSKVNTLLEVQRMRSSHPSRFMDRYDVECKRAALTVELDKDCGMNSQDLFEEEEEEDMVIPDSRPHSPNLRCEESSVEGSSAEDEDAHWREIWQDDAQQIDADDEPTDSQLMLALDDQMTRDRQLLEEYSRVADEIDRLSRRKRELSTLLMNSSMREEHVRRNIVNEEKVAAMALLEVGAVRRQAFLDDKAASISMTLDEFRNRKLSVKSLSKELKANRLAKRQERQVNRRMRSIPKGVFYQDDSEAEVELDCGSNLSTDSEVEGDEVEGDTQNPITID